MSANHHRDGNAMQVLTPHLRRLSTPAGPPLREVPAGWLRIAERTILPRITGWWGNRVLIRLGILDGRLGWLGFILHGASSLRKFEKFLVTEDYLEAGGAGHVEFN